jgi:hypothetical protein
MQSVTTDFGLLFWQGINGFDKSDFDGILSMYLQLLDFGKTTTIHNLIPITPTRFIHNQHLTNPLCRHIKTLLLLEINY